MNRTTSFTRSIIILRMSLHKIIHTSPSSSWFNKIVIYTNSSTMRLTLIIQTLPWLNLLTWQFI